MEIDDREDYAGQVDRYLLRQASPAERRAIEDRRQRDEAFAEAMDRDEAILAVLRAGEDRALKDRLQRLEAAQPYQRLVLRRLPVRRWLAVAASLALLLLAGWWILAESAGPADTETLLAQYLEPYPNRAFNLTKGEAPITTRSRAYAAYEAGDYPGAVAAFAELTEPDLADRFYRANALLLLERPAEALPFFRALAGTADFALAPHSQWYQALSWLALDRRAAALPILERIATDANHPFQDRAASLLQRLE